VVSGPEALVAGLGQVIGRVGGPELQIVGHLRVTVSELAVARERGLSHFV
jgi:hypothetical protein